MKLPGYSAEAALYSVAAPGVPRARGRRGRQRVVPQQAFPPVRERPPIMACDPESAFTIQCAPCTLHRLPGFSRLVWLESVRNCVICYDQNGQPYPRCTPCLDRSCSPFQFVDRFAIGIN